MSREYEAARLKFQVRPISGEPGFAEPCQLIANVFRIAPAIENGPDANALFV
jgi:hypothetical protein